MTTSKRHSERVFTRGDSNSRWYNSGKYHYDLCIYGVYAMYIYILHTCTSRLTGFIGERILLILKPPVPVLLVFIPAICVALARLSGHAPAPSPTIRYYYYYYYVTDWKKYFESPSNCQSTVRIHIYIYILYGLPAYGEQSALFAKENNIIAIGSVGAESVVYCAERQPLSAVHIIFDLYVNTNILYVRYSCRTT